MWLISLANSRLQNFIKIYLIFKNCLIFYWLTRYSNLFLLYLVILCLILVAIIFMCFYLGNVHMQMLVLLFIFIYLTFLISIYLFMWLVTLLFLSLFVGINIKLIVGHRLFSGFLLFYFLLAFVIHLMFVVCLILLHYLWMVECICYFLCLFGRLLLRLLVLIKNIFLLVRLNLFYCRRKFLHGIAFEFVRIIILLGFRLGFLKLILQLLWALFHPSWLFRFHQFW